MRLQRAMEAAQFTWWMLSPRRDRAGALYNLLSTHNNLAENSLYLNMGYWKDATTYDEACEALAARVGEHAEIDEDHVVLDVGFGFGDQDALWLERHEPTRIIGLNVSTSQIKTARNRHPNTRLDFRLGSATDMPIAPQSVDRVIALESAFHFDTREDFFREAFRVLRPGGKLIVADVVGQAKSTGRLQKLAEYMGQGMWQAPAENVYSLATYRNKLELAGFEQLEVDDISEHVFAPFKAYAKQRVNAPEVRARVHPLLRTLWAAEHGGMHRATYFIMTAQRAANGA